MSKYLIILFIFYSFIIFTLGCRNYKSFDLGISSYSSNQLKIDSIWSYNTAVIVQSEHLINVNESPLLRNRDYCFRFWIGHSLGLKLYCIEVLQLDKQLYLSLATFSKSNSGDFRVESIKHKRPEKANYQRLRNVIQETRIDSIFRMVSNGIGEPGADGSWVYFQYFTPESLKLMPIDCYDCLENDEEGNKEIIDIIGSMKGVFESNFSGYLE